jgi:hypothetical protein
MKLFPKRVAITPRALKAQNEARAYGWVDETVLF